MWLQKRVTVGGHVHTLFTQERVAPAKWRDKCEELYMPIEHAAYLAKLDYKATTKDLTPNIGPPHKNLICGGGSGKNRASD